MTGLDALTGYASTYVDNMKSQANANTASDIANRDYANATDEELYEACKEFEAYFVEQVFKAMRATVPKDENSSASAFDMFEDNLYQEGPTASVRLPSWRMVPGRRWRPRVCVRS